MRPGPIYLDGGLFTDNIPKTLRDLPAHSRGQTAEQIALLTARYDERKAYAFTTQGTPDNDRGTQRYRGPALAQRGRCPNNPRSMRLDPADKPTTTCTPGEQCACGSTVTLGPDDNFQTRQRPLYCTTTWKASYGRRGAVESANANLKVHHANLQRGSTRVLGTNRTGILLAFIIAATNASLLLSRYGFDIGQPPDDAEQPLTPKPSPRTALHRKRLFRRPRRTSTGPPSKPPPPGTTTWQPITAETPRT